MKYETFNPEYLQYFVSLNGGLDEERGEGFAGAHGIGGGVLDQGAGSVEQIND